MVNGSSVLRALREWKIPSLNPWMAESGPFGRIGALFRIDSIAHIAQHRYVAQPTTNQQPDCKISERQATSWVQVDDRNKHRRHIRKGAETVLSLLCWILVWTQSFF